MAKRNWPDHPAIGHTLHDGDVPVKIVDVKAGPMMFNNSELANTYGTLIGTLRLRVEYPAGYERWLPPTEAQPLLDWCAKQAAAKTSGEGE